MFLRTAPLLFNTLQFTSDFSDCFCEIWWRETATESLVWCIDEQFFLYDLIHSELPAGLQRTKNYMKSSRFVLESVNSKDKCTFLAFKYDNVQLNLSEFLQHQDVTDQRNLTFPGNLSVEITMDHEKNENTIDTTFLSSSSIKQLNQFIQKIPLHHLNLTYLRFVFP